MKKKVIATVLAGSLLMMPVSVFADDDDDYLHTLSFDKIAEEVEERNTSVKIWSSSIDSTELNFEIQEDSIWETMDTQVANQKRSINTQIVMYQGVIDYYQGLNDETTYGPIIDGYELLVQSLQGQLAYIDSQVLDDEWEEDLEEIEDLTMSNVHLSVEMGIDGQVYSVQKMFLAYKSLEENLADMQSQYDLIKKGIDIQKLQQELGMITEANVATSEISLRQIKAGIDATNKALKDLKGSINLSLGQDYDTSLDLGDKPLLNQTLISSMDYNEDYETAKDNNYAIRQKLIEYRLADEKEEQSSGDEEDLAEIELDNTEIEYQEQLRKFDLSFDKTYQAVKDAQEALDDSWYEFSTKLTQWKHKQLMYSLGLISTLEWEQAKGVYDSAYLEYRTKQQKLFEAYLDYEWLLNGMEFLSGTPSTSSASSGTGSTQSSGMGF